jgi:hypothetical protein
MFGVIWGKITLNKACPDPSGEQRFKNIEDATTKPPSAYTKMYPKTGALSDFEIAIEKTYIYTLYCTNSGSL